MGSSTQPDTEKRRCDGCLKYCDGDLSGHDGDWLCQKCVAVLSAAMVLLDEGITAEDTIIPTMVFAKVAGGSQGWKELSQTGQLAGEHEGLELVEIMHEARGRKPPSLDRDYAGWKLVEVLDGVPMVRVEPFVVKPEIHSGTQVLKQVRIQVLSRNVKPASIGEIYEQVLAEQGTRWEENSQGIFSYYYHGYLGITVETGARLSPLDVEGMGRDPLRYPAYHFPPPILVAKFYESVLGSLKDKEGFAYALDNYGKSKDKKPNRIVLAFVAWHVGEGPGARVPPKSRPRVEAFLNKHLLEPCSLPLLLENSWGNSDRIGSNAVWRDVERYLWHRFVRLYAGGYATFANL